MAFIGPLCTGLAGRGECDRLETKGEQGHECDCNSNISCLDAHRPPAFASRGPMPLECGPLIPGESSSCPIRVRNYWDHAKAKADSSGLKPVCVLDVKDKRTW